MRSVARESFVAQMAVNGDGLSISAVEVVGDHIERLLRATFGFERHQREIASSLQEHTVAPTRTSTKPPKRRGEMPISPVKHAHNMHKCKCIVNSTSATVSTDSSTTISDRIRHAVGGTVGAVRWC